jgi:hypothetical protein
MDLLETVSAYDLHEVHENFDAFPSDEIELIQDKLKTLKYCGKIQGIGSLVCSRMHNKVLDRQGDDIQLNSFVLIGNNASDCTKICMALGKQNFLSSL